MRKIAGVYKQGAKIFSENSPQKQSKGPRLNDRCPKQDAASGWKPFFFIISYRWNFDRNSQACSQVCCLHSCPWPLMLPNTVRHTPSSLSK